MLLKIDLEKAYDKIYWNYLRDTFQRFKFPNSIIDLIIFSINTASFSILWNGVIGEAFTLERGLRKSCPLSPYLFVLCLERLTGMIEALV